MAVPGPYTGVDLSDPTALCMPWIEENKYLQPEFSQIAAMLSLELASTAYDLKTDAWREAGWHDLSYQVDNTLLSGAAINGDAGRAFSGVISDYYHRLARARVKRMDPISQLRGTLRQREGSDTCKSIVMLHRAAGGRYVVAIGFMGTGKRIYDWLSNLRLAPEAGMHLGFLQLTEEFEGNCENILFPETARELGLASLSLADILAECRRPGSRFRIWMAGHSQGGAVMQLFAFHQIRQGMLRQNMIGYGFASPSAAYENPGCDMASFPLFHIMNGDDCVPRVGARLHFGKCRVVFPDEEMRRACYGNVWDEPAFRAVLALNRRIHDSRTGLVWILALLHALEGLTDAETVAVLTGVLGRLFPEKLQSALGGRIDVFLHFLIRKTENGYLQSTGEAGVPTAQVEQMRLRIFSLIQQYGVRPFVKVLMQALSLPHKLRGVTEENSVASYQYIVTQRFGALCHRIPTGAAAPGGAPHRQSGRTPAGSRYARLSAARLRRARR